MLKWAHVCLKRCLTLARTAKKNNPTTTGKQCRAARHVRISLCAQTTVFINYSTTLSVTVWSPNESPTDGNDAGKQVFPKRRLLRGKCTHLLSPKMSSNKSSVPLSFLYFFLPSPLVLSTVFSSSVFSSVSV